MRTFFYIVALILGLTSIWMSHWDAPRTQLAGKCVATVVFFILWLAFVIGLGWYKERRRVQKIKSAVLSRPRTPGKETPAKD